MSPLTKVSQTLENHAKELATMVEITGRSALPLRARQGAIEHLARARQAIDLARAEILNATTEGKV